MRQLQPQFSGAAAKFAKDDSDENIQDIAQQTGVVGQAVAQRKWNRKHPLPDRDNREDVVDEMRGRLRHFLMAAPCRACIRSRSCVFLHKKGTNRAAGRKKAPGARARTNRSEHV
ncbi:MAG: hypothetical protein DMG15_05525 [Acidobacteria bacterium]|nr:MAG: hypothetical protein DMG15_05525 [Acidobacteriota bacterium]